MLPVGLGFWPGREPGRGRRSERWHARASSYGILVGDERQWKSVASILPRVTTEASIATYFQEREVEDEAEDGLGQGGLRLGGKRRRDGPETAQAVGRERGKSFPFFIFKLFGKLKWFEDSDFSEVLKTNIHGLLPCNFSLKHFKVFFNRGRFAHIRVFKYNLFVHFP
jgi:hypothetical protein